MNQPARGVQRGSALSRSTVAEAAGAMVAEAGFDELTLRGVARRLAVSAPSLYEYVASKEDLIDLVVAEILDAAAVDWNPPTDWEPLIRYTAIWWHHILREHEAVYMSVLRRPLAAPVALDTVDRVLSSLAHAGFGPRQAVAVYSQLFGYVVGITALVRTRTISRTAQGTTEQAAVDRTRALLDDLDPHRYPGIAGARDPLVGLAGADIFANGLEAFIDGLRCRATKRGGS